MTLENRIRDEKLQYNINREAAKISALSSGKTDKYEYPSGEEILPLNQQQIIEQAKFKKQTKAIKSQGKKQIAALADLKRKEIKPRKTKVNDYSDYFLDGLAIILYIYNPI